MKYAPLWILERIPEVYDVAEMKGVPAAEIDRWRRHTLPGVIHYFEEIYRSDPAGNAVYFSPARLFRRFKHLTDFVDSLPALREIYKAAQALGHPAAVDPVEIALPELGGSPR
jgi:hypothetical protein